MAELNRLTTMFLDIAGDRARRRQSTTMADWITCADAFLTFDERTSDRVRLGDRDDGKGDRGERHTEFDARHRGQEARRAVRDEWDDLRELAAIELERPDEGEP